MDSLQSYSNILGFLAGDSSFYLGAIGRKNNLHNAFDVPIASIDTVLYLASVPNAVPPFIKAAIGDLKAYRDYKGYRRIPIGYRDFAMAASNWVDGFQNYLACDIDRALAVDFYIAEVDCKNQAQLARAPQVGGFDVFNGPSITLQSSCKNPPITHPFPHLRRNLSQRLLVAAG